MCNLWQIPGFQALSPTAVAGWLPDWRRLGVEQVLLTGGEPLIYPQLAKLLDLLTAAGLAVSLATNGIGLPRQASLLSHYDIGLLVSLDGPPSVHDRLRGVPGAFAELAAGVAMVKAANPKITVNGRCTVQHGNHRHLGDTVAAAHELGLDSISFLAADVSSEAFNLKADEEQEQIQAIKLAAADLPYLAEELAALERDHADDFISGYILENPEKLHNQILCYFNALAGHGDFIPPVCNAPWVSAVIEPDGGVRPCFFHQPLANLNQQGNLESLLNSAAFLAWRRLAYQGLDLCRRCVCSLLFKNATTHAEQITFANRRRP